MNDLLLPAAARLCPARDLLIVVVQVYYPTRGRHLLSADGPGSLQQGGCASGDAVDAGGFPDWAYGGSCDLPVGRGSGRGAPP